MLEMIEDELMVEPIDNNLAYRNTEETFEVNVTRVFYCKSAIGAGNYQIRSDKIAKIWLGV